jgi:hypothetical protein
MASDAGAQATPANAVGAGDVPTVVALADSLRAYPRVMRTSEGDTTATTQAMSSHDGCRVVLTFEETGEDWQVVREMHADLSLLDGHIVVDRQKEDRDIENSEDTLPFPWTMDVHTKSGAKEVEVRRSDVKDGHRSAPLSFWVDRIEFLAPSEAGENGISKSLAAAIAACGAAGGSR